MACRRAWWLAGISLVSGDPRRDSRIVIAMQAAQQIVQRATARLSGRQRDRTEFALAADVTGTDQTSEFCTP